MTIPLEAVSAIVRNSYLSKEEIFDLINEWQPDVSDDQLEEFWELRKRRIN